MKTLTIITALVLASGVAFANDHEAPAAPAAGVSAPADAAHGDKMAGKMDKKKHDKKGAKKEEAKH